MHHFCRRSQHAQERTVFRTTAIGVAKIVFGSQRMVQQKRIIVHEIGRYRVVGSNGTTRRRKNIHHAEIEKTLQSVKLHRTGSPRSHLDFRDIDSQLFEEILRTSKKYGGKLSKC